MNLLVLGASGGCGQWLSRIALERGHHVRALVRLATSFEPPEHVVDYEPYQPSLGEVEGERGAEPETVAEPGEGTASSIVSLGCAP